MKSGAWPAESTSQHMGSRSPPRDANISVLIALRSRRLMAYICPLGKLQTDKMDKESIKSDAWRNDGILVVDATDDRLNWVERQMVINLGNKLFGEKK